MFEIERRRSYPPSLPTPVSSPIALRCLHRDGKTPLDIFVILLMIHENSVFDKLVDACGQQRIKNRNILQ